MEHAEAKQLCAARLRHSPAAQGPLSGSSSTGVLSRALASISRSLPSPQPPVSFRATFVSEHCVLRLFFQVRAMSEWLAVWTGASLAVLDSALAPHETNNNAASVAGRGGGSFHCQHHAGSGSLRAAVLRHRRTRRRRRRRRRGHSLCISGTTLSRPRSWASYGSLSRIACRS